MFLFVQDVMCMGICVYVHIREQSVTHYGTKSFNYFVLLKTCILFPIVIKY
jgi:hypothetical protein